MSNFLTRLFRRSKIDRTPRPAGTTALPPSPNPYDLMDWSPQAKGGSQPAKEATSMEPAGASASVAGTPTAPISEALATFRTPVNGGAGRRASAPPTRPPSGAPPVPPPPLPKPKGAQIRLLMGDGTVVEVAGDPELERRIAYLAANLFSPPSGEIAETTPTLHESMLEALETEMQSLGTELEPLGMELDAPETELEPLGTEPDTPERESEPAVLWPQVRLVFSDGSEAALPPDQEIVDRVAYVITNLLPARPVA